MQGLHASACMHLVHGARHWHSSSWCEHGLQRGALWESRKDHLAWGWLSRATGGGDSHLPVAGAGGVWEHAWQRVDAGVQLQQQGGWWVGAIHACKVFPGGS